MPMPRPRHLEMASVSSMGDQRARLDARRPQDVAEDVELLAGDGEREERFAGEVAGLEIPAAREGMARAHDRHELVVEERVDGDAAVPNGIAHDSDVEIAREQRRNGRRVASSTIRTSTPGCAAWNFRSGSGSQW